MPTTWASTAAGSLRRTPITVRAVFRCVASRNRKRPGPGQPQLWLRCVVERRQSRGQLVDDVYGFRCPLLGLQLRLSRPNGQQNARWARFSVALPPGTPKGCFTGLAGEKRRADCLRSNLQRKFGLAPTPLRLCKTPVGVPSGTAEAAQLCESRKAQPGTRLLSPRNAASKRRAGRTPPPRRKAGAAQHTKIGLLSEQLSQAPALSHLVTNRAHRARESPPPHAARATFTAFIPLNRWRQLVDS